jgi:serine/threonine protein kinase
VAPARRSFAVGGILGRGGMGEVYRARMTTAAGVTTDVALKVLLRELGGDGQAARRMRDEGRLLARLHHPGIVQVHDLVELDIEPVATGVRVVVSGHSHKPTIAEQGDVLYVNPGSAGPRRFKLPISAGELIVIGSSVSARIVELGLLP